MHMTRQKRERGTEEVHPVAPHIRRSSFILLILHIHSNALCEFAAMAAAVLDPPHLAPYRLFGTDSQGRSSETY